MGARIVCLAGSGGAVVSAHRGGPQGPENSLRAVAASMAAGVLVVEIDAGLARDGTVMALHDRTLDRTTTGAGPLAARSRQELARLTLKDRSGAVTAEPLPTLAAVLAAARGRAIISIDLKPSVGSDDPGRARAFARLVRAVGRTVRAAGAREEVMLIAYSVEEARVIRQLLPWADLSVSARTGAELDAYRAAGIDPARAMVFAGVLRPAEGPPAGPPGMTAGPVAVRVPGGLAALPMPVIVGTLGREGQRLDDLFAADGDVSEYVALVRGGADVIATDTALAAQAALEAGVAPDALQAAARCLVGPWLPR
jgi:glycerophosphoryl diester phosphodiesterase